MSEVTILFSMSYAVWLVAGKRAKLLKIGTGQWYSGVDWGWRTQRSLERFRASALWRAIPRVVGLSGVEQMTANEDTTKPLDFRCICVILWMEVSSHVHFAFSLY